MQAAARIAQWLNHEKRERIRAFVRFLARRFWDDDCLQAAGALSYTTLLALVPLTAAVLGVVAMFPVWQRWGDALTIYLFTHFVPKAAANVADTIRSLAANARGMTGFGAAGLLATALLTMASIEDAFNRIWRVATPRRPVARFLIYWAALTLGPLLAIASLAISSYLFSLPVVAVAEQSAWSKFGLNLLPPVLEATAFSLAYAAIPNRSVAWRHAFAGGLLATVLFEGAKDAIAYYLTRASYQQLYGALAAFPIFLLWIWVSWLVVLLGASFAASLSAFRFQPAAMRLPPGHEFYALLRVLGRFAQAREAGRGLHTAQLHELEPILTDDLLQRLLAALVGIAVLRRAESGEWLLSRDLGSVSLREVCEAANLRIPLSDVSLPCATDALGQRVQAALDELRVPLRARMAHGVGAIYESTPARPE